MRKRDKEKAYLMEGFGPPRYDTNLWFLFFSLKPLSLSFGR